MNVFFGATRLRLRLRVLLWFAAGNAAFALCAALWLKIPDSHVWELLVSVLFGAAILIGFFCLNAKVMRSMRAALDPLRLLVGSFVLFGWSVMLWLLMMPAVPLDAGSDKRAGYWNSQLSPHMRTTFTYERLSSWQSDLIFFVFSFVIPALLLPWIIETVSRRFSLEAWRNGMRVLRRWQYWLVALIAFFLGRWLWSHILAWKPGTSLGAQLTSLILRVSVLYGLECFLALCVLALTSELLARSDLSRNAAADPVLDRTKPLL